MMWGYGSNMMEGWGGMLGPLSMIFWFLVILAVMVGLAWLLRAAWPRDRSTISGSSSLDVLKERYARGDITREEYLQKQRDIAG